MASDFTKKGEADMVKKPGVVVQTPELNALEHPKFVVEYQGRLYVTVAVIEYDPRATGITEEQAQSVAELKDLFASSYAAHPLRAALIEQPMAMLRGMNTAPD